MKKHTQLNESELKGGIKMKEEEFEAYEDEEEDNEEEEEEEVVQPVKKQVAKPQPQLPLTKKPQKAVQKVPEEEEAEAEAEAEAEEPKPVKPTMEQIVNAITNITNAITNLDQRQTATEAALFRVKGSI